MPMIIQLIAMLTIVNTLGIIILVPTVVMAYKRIQHMNEATNKILYNLAQMEIDDVRQGLLMAEKIFDKELSKDRP